MEATLRVAAPGNGPALCLATAVSGAFLSGLSFDGRGGLGGVFLDGSTQPLDLHLFKPRLDRSNLSLPREVYLPPPRSFRGRNGSLPTEAATFWPTDLLSVLDILPEADNADFWSSVLRDVLLHEEEICCGWWERECERWEYSWSAEVEADMRRMARDQATFVMQGLCTLLALGSLIGFYNRPGPHIFPSWGGEDGWPPLSWAFWPPEDDAKFGELPYEPHTHLYSEATGAAYTNEELAAV